jgi:hypothetical protein
VQPDDPYRDDVQRAVQGASRSFLLRVGAGLAVVVGAVGFATQRNSTSAAGGSTTNVAATSSPAGVADLAPPTTAGPPVQQPGQTVPAVTLPLAAIPETGLGTPQAAARNLWDAWKDRDRTRALLYASPKSVNKLFASTWVPQVRQAGCAPFSNEWLCRFEGPKFRWDSTISGNQTKGFRVIAVFVGDPLGDLVTPDSLPVVTNVIPVSTNPDGSRVQLGPSVPPDFGTTTISGDAAAETTNTPTTKTGTKAGKKRKRSSPLPAATKSSKKTKSTPSSNAKRTTDPIPEATPEPAAKPAAKPVATPAPAEKGPVPVQGGPSPVPVG